MYLQWYCLMFYCTSPSARVPWWASGQVTWALQESHDSVPSEGSYVRRADHEKHTQRKQKSNICQPDCPVRLHTQPAADVLIRNVKQQGRENDMVSAFFSSSYLKVRVASACRWANFPFFPLCQAELGLSITRADQTGGKGLSGGIPQIMRLMCLFFMFVQCHYGYERLG